MTNLAPSRSYVSPSRKVPAVGLIAPMVRQQTVGLSANIMSPGLSDMAYTHPEALQLLCKYCALAMRARRYMSHVNWPSLAAATHEHYNLEPSYCSIIVILIGNDRVNIVFKGLHLEYFEHQKCIDPIAGPFLASHLLSCHKHLTPFLTTSLCLTSKPRLV